MKVIHKTLFDRGTRGKYVSVCFWEPTLGHAVVLSLDVPENAGREGPKWKWNGSEEKPTIRASVLQKGEHTNHFFVTDGVIEYLDDCTHENKGKKVPMIEWNKEVSESGAFS